jgi:prepilin-type N-terminal cleavage/methylation domain-containing protein
MAKKTKQKAFTLVETVVSVAIFAILAVTAYGLYATIARAITNYRGASTVSSLADQYLEIARNLPYSEVGTQSGNPHGPLPDSFSPINVSFNGNEYSIYYVVNAIHDPADINVGVQDYKQVKLYIENVSTGEKKSFVTTIAPISLASMGSGGVLSIQVINKAWQPVPYATINITNIDLEPNINLLRTTDDQGRWLEIGLPADDHYRIIVTKDGYSDDQTYSADDYPGATNQDAAVILGQVTNATFIIDHLSSLSFYTLDQTCQPLPSLGVIVGGAKLIAPGVLKFYEEYTSNLSGLISPSTTSSCSNTCGVASCCLEYDTYSPAVGEGTYMVYGTSPVQSVDLLPDSNQNFNLILGQRTANSLLVVVKDASENPIEGATVELQGPTTASGVTGGSAWNQNEWTGGPGQEDFQDASKYYYDDGNISASEIPEALRLLKVDGSYMPFGSLVSSTFDTGTEETRYTSLTWKPEVQADPATIVKFQIASNNDNETWDFTGPDGTDDSFYTASGTPINSMNDNNRYIRYKAFLSTTKTNQTPVLSSVTINYVSGCPTPGQVMLPGLVQSNTYSVTVSYDEAGYQPQTVNNLGINGYFILQVTLYQ